MGIKQVPVEGQKQSGRRLKYVNNPWVYICIMAVVLIVIFSSFFFSNKMLFSSDQLAGLDSRVYLQTSVQKHHQFPFWLNSRLGGMPTIDALFGDAFYPVSLFFHTVLPVHRAIGIKMILHIFLAGLFFFLLLHRGFKISAPLAFIGGTFYMLNPEFFSHIYPGHDGKMYVIAWLPFMVWRLKALSEKITLRNATLFSLGIGISLLTSHIQMTYFVLWGLFFYAVFVVVQNLLRHDKRAAIRFSAFFCLAVAVGLGIGFIQLFPSSMYIREAFSVRGVDRGFEYAASWSLHWPEFFSLWVPEFGNTLDYYWGGNPFKLNSEYSGGIALLLAVMAVVLKSRPWRWFWVGVAAFALLYSLGAHTPVFHAAYALIPGVKKFRACSMIMFWFSFAIVLLASLCLNDMIKGDWKGMDEKRKGKWTKRIYIAVGVLAALTVFFSAKDIVAGIFPFVSSLDSQKKRLFDLNFSRNFVPMLWVWLLFSGITLILLAAVIRGKLRPGVAAGIIFAVGFVDILRIDTQFIKTIDARSYLYTDPVLQKLQKEMATAPFRIFSLPEVLPQNGEGVHGLEGIGGFHDNELNWYREFRGDQQDRNYFDKLLGFTPNGEAYLKAERINQGNAFLNLANVKYLLARNGSNLVPIENQNALGRVSFTPEYIVMDSSRIVQALQQNGYDIRTTVALFEEPARKPPADSAQNDTGGTFTARWQRYTPNDRIVKVTVPRDGFLRISEVFYPGWKIRIDGKEVPLYRSDLAWMAVFIPQGEHMVEMNARSLYFGTAAWISFPLVLLLCLYWGALAVLTKRKRP